VLDVVRAARGLSRSVGRTFAIAGHSQGGHAALFAGSLAPRWTPELRLRGVASYAPASHVLEQAELLPALKTPSSLSALATLIVQGASAANAAVRPQDLLSAPALALYPQTNRLCLDKLGLASSLGGLAPSTLLRPGADLTALESVLATMNPAVRIGAPVLMLQGLADTTVFPNFTTQLDGELRAKGTNVTYTTFPGVNHGEVVVAGNPAATAFLTSRLGG
jgi:pimeloyl-ACP methyl ester carboxylesterase